MISSRHVPTFDSDDDSDSALVQTRIASRRPFSGEAHEVSRSHLGPHQPRSGFASRVPVEPAYPNPPPNYHPSYYAPPTQPPHYQNHGYGMSQPGYPNPNPNPYGPSSHSSSSPYQESWSQYPPGYPPYGSPPQRQDSSGSRDFPLHAIEGRPAIEDGPGDVFSHLNVLLARYKEQHSQLSVREDLLRRASAEQEEKVRAKDAEIADLKERFRSLENKHSAETSRLYFQIGNLEEQVKEFREQIAETKRFRREAEESRAALDAAMRSWEDRYKELEDVHRALERTTAEEKARAWRDFDDWKSTTNTRHDAEKIALAIQFDKKLKQADSSSEELRREAAELERNLCTAQKALEEAVTRERESRDAWSAERDTLIQAHKDHRNVQKGWEEQREHLEAQHKQIREESDKAWTELHAEAARMAEEEKARADRLMHEKDELLKKYNQLKAESQKEKEIIKSVANNLESEKSRLEKMMECYGDIAEIKSKGDTY
jgi:serine/arginine repetitive matrix protein 2